LDHTVPKVDLTVETAIAEVKAAIADDRDAVASDKGAVPQHDSSLQSVQSASSIAMQVKLKRARRAGMNAAGKANETLSTSKKTLVVKEMGK
jgi:hypothetical protein